MRKLTRLLLVATVLFACVGCDQATKFVARSHLRDSPDITFLYDTVRLTYAENPGAFLGLGASLPAPARAAVFRGAIGLVVLALVLSAALWPGLARRQVIALTLLGASGMGNLIDRYLYEGQVTDFLNLGIGNLRTGIFNVADVLGVVAITMLLALRKDSTPPRRSLPH